MMDGPASLTQWFFSYDGYQVQIDAAQAQAFAQMWPDYAEHPNGPFPGIDLSKIPWDPQYGPFAPDREWQQYGGFFRGLGRLYAWKWVIIDKHVYAEGEILPPTPTTHEREKLLRSGDLARVPDDVQTVTHNQTGRVFFDPTTHDDYHQRYAARDLAGIFPGVLSSQDSALMPAPDDGPQPESPGSRQPRGRQAHYTAWTDAQAVRILKHAAHEVRKAGLPLSQTTLGKYLPGTRHRNTVRQILDWHGITLDDL